MLGGIYDWLQKVLDSNHITITACGTSWHASLIGSFILEELLDKNVNNKKALSRYLFNQNYNSKMNIEKISNSD